MQKYINHPKQEFLEKAAIYQKNECRRGLYLLFQPVVPCSDPERISIKQVVPV